MDHDGAGFNALKKWVEVLPYSRDKSDVYQKFNDYNDKLKADLKAEHQSQAQKR